MSGDDPRSTDDDTDELPLLDQADWLDLKPHASKDRLILVDRHLDIMVVAQAIATDDQNQVSRWISQKLLTKPTAEQYEGWEDGKKFLFSIVKPFVLAQEGALH